MGRSELFWPHASAFLVAQRPERPVLFFSAPLLQDTARMFTEGFPGQVTYAVKANPVDEVLCNLVAAGLDAFDVASPAEITAVRAVLPSAQLHYNNPVRSVAEIEMAAAHDVYSYSVDSASELEKLARIVPAKGHEIAVRFKLNVKGATYDFGSKFGAGPEAAAALLRRVAELGFSPALTFHPGTQCVDPRAWVRYIEVAAEIAIAANVTLARLNVGGGFPAHRAGHDAPDYDAIFQAIKDATDIGFGKNAPALVCEPGRAMVAEAYALAARVKSIRDDRDIFLNDGIYGAMAELPLLGALSRIAIMDETGAHRTGNPILRPVFGPTCDSLDRLPDTLALPCDLQEGDYMVIRGIGAYSTVTNTRFNGYGDYQKAEVSSFD